LGRQIFPNDIFTFAFPSGSGPPILASVVRKEGIEQRRTASLENTCIAYVVE